MCAPWGTMRHFAAQSTLQSLSALGCNAIFFQQITLAKFL